MEQLFRDVRVLSARILSVQSATRRGTYNAQPIKRLLEKILKGFNKEAPVDQFFHTVLSVDPVLARLPYRPACVGLELQLQRALDQACKDTHGIVAAVTRFVAPLCYDAP